MPRTPPSPLILPGLAFTLALAGCSPTGIDMTNAATPSDAPASRTNAPAFRKNPAPVQAYRITMRIDDAPGPFAHMLGLAQFDVVNRDCLPPPDDNHGHLWPVPTEGVEIKLEKVADNTYSGIVYADQMLDEDYFGRGVCQWRLVQAQVQLKATGARAESKFIPSINADKILAGRAETVYMAKEDYPLVATVEDYPTFGETDRRKFHIADDQLFTVKFVAEKQAP